jgi:hypothetical protein
MSLKFNSRVFEFTVFIGLTTALIGFGAVKTFGQTDDEKEAMLRQKYPELIKQNQANRKPMQDFFKSIKDGNNEDKDKMLDGLLGKGKSTLDKRQVPSIGINDNIITAQNPVVVPLKEKTDLKVSK